MEYFNHRGRRVAYIQHGQGAPVVFLHNGGTSHAIWQPVMAILAGEYSLVALDLPGYGESEPPASYSLAAYAAMLDDFLQARLGREPVILVGNCMGSAIALHFAQRQPQRVRALVLINPLTEATFSAGGFGALQGLRWRLPGLTQRLARLTGRVRIPSALTTTAIRLQLGARGHAQQLWKNPDLRACYRNPSNMAALSGLFTAIPDFAEFDSLQGSTALPPIHTLWGRQNRVLAASAGERLNQRLQPAQALVLEDCGHLLMLERPEVVGTVIRDLQEGEGIGQGM